jgi:hypothetical protein
VVFAPPGSALVELNPAIFWEPRKVLSRIIVDRARSVPLLDVQHGFRRADGTCPAIFVAKRIIEDCRRAGLPLVVTFIDLVKAYDNLPREVIWDTMRRY